MAFFQLLAALISPVTEVLKGKQQIIAANNKAKTDIVQAVTAAKTKSIERGDLSNIQMDNEARSLAGWMDDLSFAIFLSPAVLCFFPPALPHITAGFIALKSMPQWWQAALGMMLVSVWGYRKLVSPIIQSIAKAWLGRAK